MSRLLPKKLGLCLITKKWFKLELSCKKYILHINLAIQIQEEKTLALKLTDLWPFKVSFSRKYGRLNFCAIPLYIKQSFFVFSRWTLSWYSILFLTWKTSPGVSIPGSSLLCHILHGKGLWHSFCSTFHENEATTLKTFNLRNLQSSVKLKMLAW